MSSQRGEMETISRVTERCREQGYDKRTARRMAEESMRRTVRTLNDKERRGGRDGEQR